MAVEKVDECDDLTITYHLLQLQDLPKILFATLLKAFLNYIKVMCRKGLGEGGGEERRSIPDTVRWCSQYEDCFYVYAFSALAKSGLLLS